MTDTDALRSGVPALLRLFLGAMLVLSGYSKLTDLAGFSRSLRGLLPLTMGLHQSLVRAVPALEVMLGGWLVWGDGRTAFVAAVAAGAFAAFGIVVARVLLQGRRPDCGCFGRLTQQRVSWAMVTRNACFCVAAVVVAVGSSSARSWATGLPWLMAVVAAVIGAGLIAEGVRLARATTLPRQVGRDVR